MFTVIELGIVTLSVEPGMVPPQVAGLFQSPFWTAVNVTSWPEVLWVLFRADNFRIDDAFNVFGIDDMLGRIGKCESLFELAKSDAVIPVADPTSADVKLNEFEIVPTSKITINDAMPTLFCTYSIPISILINRSSKLGTLF